MTDAKPVSTTAAVLGFILSGLCLLLWPLVVAMNSDLGFGGDAAGQGMAQGFAVVADMLLYAMLAGLALCAVLGGAIPALGKAILLSLVALGGLMAFAAFDLLQNPSMPPGLWPLLVVAGPPPLIIVFSLWALTPLRRLIAEPVAYGLVFSIAATLCLALAPMYWVRDTAVKRAQAQEAAFRARFAALPADAPLWDWLPFVQSDIYDVGQEARAKILQLPRRQGDAEAMLDRDELPFSLLNQYDFDPTQSLCEKARASLTRRAAALSIRPKTPNTDAAIEAEVESALDGMRWLVGLNCSCDAETKAWEELVRARGVSEYRLKNLADLRDPRELGETLFNHPPHFSMLTPRSTLHAWVGFAVASGASKEQYRAAMDGARKLDHRTADAVTWLTDPRYESDRFELMSVLPRLDLEATPALCAPGLDYVRDSLAKVYRPKGDDEPRSFRQLEYSFGIDQPLTNLLWFASKGCDAEAALNDGEALVRAYGDTPDRELMLARIAAMRHKP